VVKFLIIPRPLTTTRGTISEAIAGLITKKVALIKELAVLNRSHMVEAKIETVKRRGKENMTGKKAEAEVGAGIGIAKRIKKKANLNRSRALDQERGLKKAPLIGIGDDFILFFDIS
jgi:hypothetical protein